MGICELHFARSRAREAPALKTCAGIIFFFFAILNIVLEEFVSEFLPGITPRLRAAPPSPSLWLGDRDTQRFAFYHTQNQLSIGLRPHFSASIVKLWGIQ